MTTKDELMCAAPAFPVERVVRPVDERRQGRWWPERKRMIWNLKDLLEHANSVACEINGQWLPARPLAGPFRWRLQAAWAVLRGRADAVVWPGGQ